MKGRIQKIKYRTLKITFRGGHVVEYNCQSMKSLIESIRRNDEERNSDNNQKSK